MLRAVGESGKAAWSLAILGLRTADDAGRESDAVGRRTDSAQWVLGGGRPPESLLLSRYE